ncbi:transcriptional regulator [Spirosoma foliorum]|uniref:Transcriptional regulator n=1 Tax=Spirosoma foliorum TaxID=2710596 RepID=A0A7G5GZB9_9BACT|nr:transcriptional regulator [Spirosoma foliorum]QMW04211.1 transcriptional regulator [Spirosoma foliorum]
MIFPSLSRLILILLIVRPLFFQPAKAQVDTLFRLSPDLRIFRLFQKQAPYYSIGHTPYLKNAQDSARAFAQLDRLATFAQNQDDDRLFWTVQLHKILCRHELVKAMGKPSSVLLAAQPYMDKCPVPVVQAAYWHHRGRYAYETQQFDEGFRWLLRAQQTFEQIGYEHIPEINDYLYNLGAEYYFFGEYKTCIHYLLSSFYYPPLVERIGIAAHNTVGLCYQHLHQYGKAQAYFFQTLRLAGKHGDSAYVAIANSNIGHLLLLQNKSRLALPYLYKGYQFSFQRRHEYQVPENAALTALYVAQALLNLDSTQKARTYLIHSTRLFTNRPWSDYDLQYYQVQTQYYKKVGNFRLATIYLDSLRGIENSQRTLFNTRLLAASQSQVNAERYLNDLRKLEASQSKAVWVRNMVLLVAVLLILAGIYAFRQNQQKRWQEKQVLLAQQQRAEQLLAQYMVNIQEKNHLIDTISAQIDPDELAHPTRPSIKSLQNRVILTEDDWQQFKELFEDVYPNFFSVILSRYPDLTKAEIRLLVLSKLQIDTTQMSRILGISPESIHKTTYRLRKKLGISGKINLNNLFENESTTQS